METNMTDALVKTLELYKRYDCEYPFLWGWCPPEKAEIIADLLKDIPDPICVEIGVFGGRSAIPVLYSLGNHGQFYAIDPWTNEEASRGYAPRDAEYWSNIPINRYEEVFRRALREIGKEYQVNILKCTSDAAISLIPPKVDFDYLHIDGQHTQSQLISDINNYATRVKVGGICILDDVCNNNDYWNVQYLNHYILSLGFVVIGNIDKAIIYKRVELINHDWSEFDKEGIETTVEIAFKKRKVFSDHFQVDSLTRPKSCPDVCYVVHVRKGNDAKEFLQKCSNIHHVRVYEPSGKDVTFEALGSPDWFDRFESYWTKTNPSKNYLIIHCDQVGHYIRHPLEVSSPKSRKPKVWVVDNFYADPDSVRNFALSKKYHEGGFGKGYIGRRTVDRFHTDELYDRFSNIMGMKLDLKAWDENGMNGRFQIAWAGEPLVYHCDSQRWAAMIFLTPDAPYSCGTTLYAHKKTRARSYHDDGWDASWGTELGGDPHLDGTPFEPVDVIGNVYNRLVIFDASCIHSASQYFGTVANNARLWHMFFFD
jgi:hypothetical protein